VPAAVVAAMVSHSAHLSISVGEVPAAVVAAMVSHSAHLSISVLQEEEVTTAVVGGAGDRGAAGATLAVAGDPLAVAGVTMAVAEVTTAVAGDPPVAEETLVAGAAGTLVVAVTLAGEAAATSAAAAVGGETSAAVVEAAVAVVVEVLAVLPVHLGSTVSRALSSRWVKVCVSRIAALAWEFQPPCRTLKRVVTRSIVKSFAALVVLLCHRKTVNKICRSTRPLCP